MHDDQTGRFQDSWCSLLGADPADQDWPHEFAVAGARGPLPATFDPHNALLLLRGVGGADLAAPEVQLCIGAGDHTPQWCSRVLVFGQEMIAESWMGSGYAPEGIIADFWPNGTEAQLWGKSWGARGVEAVGASSIARRSGFPVDSNPLPVGWSCRSADLGDAESILELLRQAFPKYPLPEDPGALRYGLAQGDLHGRLILNQDGELAAYAALEFSEAGHSAELTDCATALPYRKQGLMVNLVERLEEDLEDVFDNRARHSLAREDQQGMQEVLARRGWLESGRLPNHFREGDTWVSARVWSGRG